MSAYNNYCTNIHRDRERERMCAALLIRGAPSRPPSALSSSSSPDFNFNARVLCERVWICPLTEMWDYQSGAFISVFPRNYCWTRRAAQRHAAFCARANNIFAQNIIRTLLLFLSSCAFPTHSPYPTVLLSPCALPLMPRVTRASRAGRAIAAGAPAETRESNLA